MTLMPMPAGGDVPGIDADSERWRAFVMLAAIVAFVLSAWHSANELRYAFFGQIAAARVVRVEQVSEPGRRRPRKYLRVEIEFPAGGDSRQAALRAPLDGKIAAGQVVEVQFLPTAPDRIRFRGEHETLWAMVFIGSTAWITWTLMRLAADARPTPRRKGRRETS